MTPNENGELERGVEDALRGVIRGWYGRDGQIIERGERLDVRGAGYVLSLGWGGVPAVLAAEGTSFRTVDLSLRLDLAVRDILLYPEDPADADWAWRYGYRSPDALGRAFRRRFGLGVGEVRRVGTVGKWLAMGEREPKSPAAVARLDEAWLRVRALKKYLKGRELGPDGMQSFTELERRALDGRSGRRPRYPTIGSREAVWLQRFNDRDA